MYLKQILTLYGNEKNLQDINSYGSLTSKLNRAYYFQNDNNRRGVGDGQAGEAMNTNEVEEGWRYERWIRLSGTDYK